jgi:ribonuclease HI
MASLSAQDKEEIAEQLRIVAGWVTGPRQAKVNALADRIVGAEADNAPEPSENGPEPSIEE